MSRKNAGNKQMDRAMTTPATTTKATTILSSMLVVLVLLLLLLLIAGQVAVEAFVGGLSRSCLPFDIQRRCVLPVSLAATQRDDPQQQAEAEDSPENKKHVAFFAATTTTLVDHNDKGDYKDDDSDDSWKTGFGKNVEYLSLTLKQHKPLGCTVEESLSSVAATTTDQKKSNKQKKKKTESLHYVFVTKVVEGGNADHAGILPGDVIIGVTATFGGGPTGAVENVAGLGMNKV
jgi:C-terminal processing protease CtpA/Prc